MTERPQILRGDADAGSGVSVPGRSPDPGTRDPQPVVESVNVSKWFGANHVLDDVSMTVAAGETRALLGRNGAGKSTLVAVLTGMLRPDQGEVLFAGESAPNPSARESWRELVSCVYQRSTIIPDLTVAENLFLNAAASSRFGTVNWRKLRDRADEALAGWGLDDVDVDQPASALTVAQGQIIEIARALAQGARFIILDEPTAQLEMHEIQRLFERMRLLGESGVTFLYISHHLMEVFEICDAVTVLRDGKVVADRSTTGLTKDELVATMVGAAGRRASRRKPRVASRSDEAVLAIENLQLAGSFDDISLDVHAGELVGLAGLIGSGKDDVADVVAGLRIPDGGSVRVHGRRIPLGRVDRLQRAGVGFVPRDRHAAGFVADLGVAENLTLTIVDRISRHGIISDRQRETVASGLIAGLEIKAASQSQRVGDLSGGNQQKVVVGRALALEPDVLVLIGPTAGVDVAAKEALFEIIDGARDAGASCLMVSDELDELTQCDRVLVMFDGKVSQTFEGPWTDEEMVAAIEGASHSGSEVPEP